VGVEMTVVSGSLSTNYLLNQKLYLNEVLKGWLLIYYLN